LKPRRASEIHIPFGILERGKSGNNRSLMSYGRLITRHTVLSVCFVLLYLALNLPQVILISQLGSVAWYPATGLVLALLLGVSPSYAVLILFANALAGAMFYHQPLTSFGETVGSVGVAACYGAAAYVLRGPMKIDLGLRRRQDVVRYVFVTLTAAMAATVIGVTCLAADKSIPWSEFWPSAWGWFAGDGIGLLGVAPFLLIHVFPWVRRLLSPTTKEVGQENKLPRRIARFNPVHVAETMGQAVAIMGVLWIMFGPQFGSRQLFYLSFVPIIWIAMRQGIRRAVSGMLALNFGMVVAMHVFPPVPGVPAKVGLLMLVISGVGLIVGSAVSERHRIALDLQEQTAHLNSLIENSPFGIVVLDQQGLVELTNAAFDKLFRFDQRELNGSDLSRIFVPDDAWTESTLSIEKIIADETLHATAKRRRKDGQILDIEVHAVPLLVDGRVRGSYMIYKDISEQIRASQAERQHAEVLNQLVSELQLRTKQMTLLSEMGDLLECCGTTQEACAVVAQSVQKLLPEAHSGTLYLFKSSRNLVEAVARWGGDSVSESVFSPDACWSLRRGQPHWNELAGGVNCTHLAVGSTKKCLCVPMVGQGDTLGVLHLEFAGHAEPRTDAASENPQDSQQRIATTVAGQIALSLASLRLRETLRDQSIRDPLTGLFNRRFMEESLEREMQRAVRKNHPVSVLFVDLDHFKRFNDTFGHDAGDLVLRSIADLFRSIFRVDDVVCRYGGEEFGIILPESSAENAAIRANGLREATKRLEVRYKNQTLGTITLSIGVATFPDHGQTSEALLKAADQCLYRSKAGGRDLVTVATRRSGDRDLAEVEGLPE
jgi:diguanylate cyclase (GGDEF)-like protein/PAS domain S-box-containing protein